MDPNVLKGLWLIIGSVGVLAMIVFLRKYQNEEKLAMIEKGINPLEGQPPKVASMAALRFALLIIGAGIGLLIGNVLEELGMHRPVAYFAMVFVFGGIGLVASYIIEQRKIKQDQQKIQ